MSKALFKCQKLIKQPKRVLTNHGVIWAISKLTKIRNQDMEIDIFMLCFKICPCGVGFKLRGVFCVFYK